MSRTLSRQDFVRDFLFSYDNRWSGCVLVGVWWAYCTYFFMRFSELIGEGQLRKSGPRGLPAKDGVGAPAWMAGILAIALGFLGCGPELFAQNRDLKQSEVSQRVIGEIVADAHVVDSALDVHRQALQFTAAQRYEFLADWVLPTGSHATFRLALDFTATHPAPPVSDHHPIDSKRIEFAKERGETRVQTGAHLISPALDLIEVARELGKLAELRTRVEATVAANELQEKAKLSLLALIDIAIGEIDTAHRELDALYLLIEGNNEHTLSARAADLLAIHGASEHPQTRGFARDAATNLYARGVRVPNHGPPVAWESHLMALLATLRNFDRTVGESSDMASAVTEVSLAPRLSEWSPASRTTALSRGRGHSTSHWQRVAMRIENAISHQDDFLYYHIPLQGNYQVECDVQNINYQNTELVVGGHWAEPLYYSRNKYDFGDLRERLGRGEVHPTLTKYNEWVHVRATVRDGTITFHVNGRELHHVEARGEVDPWVILRSESRFDGAATDIRITGDPVVPGELGLTASEDLNGWLPYYPGAVGKPKATWQQLGDVANGGGIVAPRRTDLAGMNVERLLRYHRPMFEDGSIEFEFFYREGASHVHPALDRLVFLLDPNGVRIHWVTDAEYDRTGLFQGNAFDEPAQRRGPEQLPLKENDWNRLRLTVEGDSVSLHLNDQLIYQRELEITNQRTFGLFHFSDRTEARVRNVRWRGSWPRELPPVARQELASQVAQLPDERLPDLGAVFEHSFAKGGVAPENFTLVSSPGGTMEQVSEGVRVNRPGGSGYQATSIALNATVEGDFDIVATYRHFAAQPGANSIGTAGLRLLMSDVNPQQCLLLRRLVRKPKEEDRHVTQAVLRNGATEATLDWNTVYSDAQEADSGRLRIARRGKRIYYLAAEADSPNFRMLGESEVPHGPLAGQGVQLLAQTSGEGPLSVVWSDIMVRATKLKVLPSPGALGQTLAVMNHDGTALRQLLPKDTPIVGPGSPAWSRDGKLIAFDVYNGSTANSRMYLINADGSNLRELGIGNMPTFSPDGQRIAFSWDGKGVGVMNVDGTQREVLESNGWGAQWSPDGRIAYARGGNVIVHDLRTKTQKELLEGEQSTRYANVYWNLGWSRDGKMICFKARNGSDHQYEIAVAAAAGSHQEFRVLYKSRLETYADFSWHPDGSRILFPMQIGGVPRLFILDSQQPGPPTLLQGQPLDQYVTAADWSSDGRQIVICGQHLPETSEPAASP